MNVARENRASRDRIAVAAAGFVAERGSESVDVDGRGEQKGVVHSIDDRFDERIRGARLHREEQNRGDDSGVGQKARRFVRDLLSRSDRA